MTAKSVIVTTALIISAAALAGCQNQNPGQETNLGTGNLPYNQTNTPTDSSGLNVGSATPSANDQQVLPPGKGPMKQLSDFENIPATQATISTTKGDITFTFYRDEAPITVANWLSLAKSGYYDGIVFHRVIPDFMAQVGDPLTKDASKQAMWGSGGPGYTIPDEFSPNLVHDSEGIVSMANAGVGTGGSQFFITYEATPWLDGKHTIFGKVTSGMDVLRQIDVGDKILSVKYQ